MVLASAGYPESSSKGDVIEGLERAAELAEVVHAGTAERDGQIVTAGGRVLNLTGLGPDAATARQCKQMRFDIATRAVERDRQGTNQ